MKRDSEIYLEASRRISECNNPSCCSVFDVSHDLDWNLQFAHERVDRYKNLFIPSEDSYSNYWLNGKISKSKQQEWRITALCLMAAICEEEGR